MVVSGVFARPSVRQGLNRGIAALTIGIAAKALSPEAALAKTVEPPKINSQAPRTEQVFVNSKQVSPVSTETESEFLDLAILVRDRNNTSANPVSIGFSTTPTSDGLIVEFDRAINFGDNSITQLAFRKDTYAGREVLSTTQVINNQEQRIILVTTPITADDESIIEAGFYLPIPLENNQVALRSVADRPGLIYVNLPEEQQEAPFFQPTVPQQRLVAAPQMLVAPPPEPTTISEIQTSIQQAIESSHFPEGCSGNIALRVLASSSSISHIDQSNISHEESDAYYINASSQECADAIEYSLSGLQTASFQDITDNEALTHAPNFDPPRSGVYSWQDGCVGLSGVVYERGNTHRGYRHHFLLEQFSLQSL